MTYIKVNNTLYPATIDGKIADYEWNRRDTKSITLTMTYSEVLALHRGVSFRRTSFRSMMKMVSY